MANEGRKDVSIVPVKGKPVQAAKRPPAVGVTPRVGIAAAELRRSAIREPVGLDRLVDEIRKDYQFALAEKTLRSLVEAITVTIEVDGDEKAQALADNLTARWKESRPKALEAIAYGRQAFERWYEWDATARIMAVAPMTAIPFSHSTIQLDEDGSIGVTVKGKGDDIPLGCDRVWWFGIDASEVEPHGRSRFLGAPLEVWRDRRTLERQGDVWRSRYALGTGVIYGPSEPAPTKPIKGAGVAGDIDISGRPIDPLEDLQKMVEMKQSGGWFVLPSERDDSGNRFYEVDTKPEVEDAGPLANEAKRLDDAALSSMGIPPRAITQDSSTGSLAMSQAHLEVLKNTVQGILFQLIASYQKHVIDPAVEVNFAEVSRPTLTLVAQPVGDALRAIINTAVQQIMVAPQVSPLITSGVIDLARMLEIAGVPTGEDVAAKLAQIQTAQAAAAAPAPGLPPRPFGMATGDPPPADAVSPEELLKRSKDELSAFWPRLTRALSNREALPRGVLQRPPA